MPYLYPSDNKNGSNGARHGNHPVSGNPCADVWDPLLKAVTLGLLGRYEEAKHFVKNLLELKPDFSERGRILIKHYIKFEDIVERVIDGLQKVGLNIV